ncbi:hypothetical protein PTSG_09449 [Salpingoeca rosetta]|uniref:Protein XRP2 n=1 Tax=Salpingoeca rosetta (strain ATCC 50818 / BSB-021) TaxID=946362 RepID=F2UMN2_SALR5|nr:uncharacterized protein PTSG_09449 [Salpingoeca rosetta]EGD78381.1 hypothetical protein PTSG_09449 [Salpingoeca rosetta]|eukprot:XP_004989704.1 hypothetical protein PTSG_09449 [Salpingoeca rosetta]
MGCVFGRMGASGDAGEPQHKVYSWDKREAKDLSQLQFKDLKGEVKGKQSGDIGKEQFQIDNCEDCSLFLFDTSAAVTIDDCKNCDIFVGPVQGSIFIRNCHNCRVVGVCQQFRTRDCTNIASALCCQTLPIIESSTGMSFFCFRGNYFALSGQMAASDISEYNNNWSRIHDFTKNKETPNFQISPEAPLWLETFYAKAAEAVPSVAVDTDPAQATVPITTQPGKPASSENVLVILFPPATKKARKFCRSIHAAQGLSLIQTREVPMEASDVSRVLHSSDTEALASAATGSVVSFEIGGETAESFVQSTLQELGLLDNAYVSTDSSSPDKDMAAFYLHADSIRKI